MRNNKFTVLLGAIVFCLTIAFGATSFAEEVDKGGIPDSNLEKSTKKLSWGAAVWDNEEAIAALKNDEKVLWVDTRPASFIEKGTIAGAINLVYNKKGLEENTLTAESLDAAISTAGLGKDSTKVIFFCQGPKCHRSYNAAYTAIHDWGFSADNIIWYRDGYPNLFTEIKDNAKLKRKAKKFITEAGIKNL